MAEKGSKFTLDSWLTHKRKSPEPEPQSTNQFEREFEDDPQPHCSSEPSSKKKRLGKSKEKTNKFHDGWLDLQECKGWLEKSLKKRGNHDVAYCKLCEADLTAHKSEIMRHKNSSKHQKHEKEIASNKNIANIVSNSLTSDDQKHEKEIASNKNIANIVSNTLTSDDERRAELKLSAFLAENNLSFRLMDTLVPLCKNIFKDISIEGNQYSSPLHQSDNENYDCDLEIGRNSEVENNAESYSQNYRRKIVSDKSRKPKRDRSDTSKTRSIKRHSDNYWEPNLEFMKFNDDPLEHEVVAFGKSIAAQMKHLPEERIVRLSAEIQKLVTQERIAYLEEQKAKNLAETPQLITVSYKAGDVTHNTFI